MPAPHRQCASVLLQDGEVLECDAGAPLGPLAAVVVPDPPPPTTRPVDSDR